MILHKQLQLKFKLIQPLPKTKKKKGVEPNTLNLQQIQTATILDYVKTKSSQMSHHLNIAGFWILIVHGESERKMKYPEVT